MLISSDIESIQTDRLNAQPHIHNTRDATIKEWKNEMNKMELCTRVIRNWTINLCDLI